MSFFRYLTVSRIRSLITGRPTSARLVAEDALLTNGTSAAPGADTTAPSITSANAISVPENQTLSHTLTANESVTWTITGGVDQARFEISGATLRWLSNGTKDFESPNDSDENNTYIVQVTARDASNHASVQTITVTVTNVLEARPFVQVIFIL